ncbi:hypothetical protein MN116_005426 [Schistosoma mekongi]|uniref:USP domain-containing protein n=1 Tax=Schistosoma mekongi TaxID=38744 RepID=A0AAE1ZDX1_SCHME|nr:hypothetical protein MN116_005426 [Schistosoma mekongi]
MDKIITGVLISSHPESMKIILIKRIRDHITKLNDTDVFEDAVFTSIQIIYSAVDYSQAYIGVVCDLLNSIESHLSDNSTTHLSQKITDAFSPLVLNLFPEALYTFIKKVLRRHAIILFQSSSETPGKLSSLSSGLHNVLKYDLLDTDKQLFLHIQHALDQSSSREPDFYDLCDDIYLDFVSNIFQVLVAFSSHLSPETFPCNHLDAELVECLARSIIAFVTVPKLTNSSRLNSSILTEYITSLVQDVLVSSSYDFHYISVASILCELQKSYSDYSALSETICRFIDHFSERRITNLEICFTVLRHLTLCLTWPELTTHQSSIDVWLTGFQCEMFRKFPPTRSQSLTSYWSDFMCWQLKFVLELMGRLLLPHESTVYAFAFFILSGDDKHDRLADDIVSHLVPVLNKLLSMYTDDPLSEGCHDILLRIYAVSRLLDSLVISSDDRTSKICTQKTKQLVGLLGKFHSQFNDECSTDVWKARTNVYELESLIKFGSQAGFSIRKAWRRWNLASTIQLVNTYPPSLKKVNRSVVGYKGLLNVGNTCYANAALQLLYHCSEFRRALFGLNATDSSFGTAVASYTSLSNNVDSVLQNQNLDPSNNLSLPTSNLYKNMLSSDTSTSSPVEHQGILHAHLLSLFQSLDTHQLPTVRDIRAVLTLTKPAHFVSGEQQDAAEYLSYLLDRLHEEELHCKKQKRISLDSYSSSSPFTIDQNIQSTTDANFNLNASCSYTTNKLSCPTDSTKCHGENVSDKDSSLSSSSSVVARLFRGTMLRHTSCVECQHVSSSRQEQFICLYVPLTKPRELLYQDQVSNENLNLVNNIPESNDSELVDEDIVEPGTDLSSLIQTHFTQIEHVASSTKCESCGKLTVQARTLKLQQLSSHVLICLNVFRYSRVNQTCSKIMHRVHVPERLSVTVSSPNTETYSYNDMSTTNDSTKSKFTSRTYSLQAMILHSGLSVSCGHYTCVAKVGMQWILFDDDNADYTTLEDIYSQPLSTPYLLLYSRT